MKIDINKIKVVPKDVSKCFKLCVFGDLSEKLKSWVEFHKLTIEFDKGFTNIIIPDDVELADLFEESFVFEYLDGFSPNLNKKLHVGHFSNLVLGKAFKCLGIAKNLVSIYGDTLEGDTSKEEAFSSLRELQTLFETVPDKEYFASQIKCDEFRLKDGKDSYDGTKIFEIEKDKIVGIKSNGKTTYFYQDVALAELLNASTLYLTGKEQSNHFQLLQKLFPHVEHIGLGLVTLSNEKMSSRLGNVIFIDDFIELAKNKLSTNDMLLIYNVFAGFILKSSLDVDKKINLDLLGNPKNSAGLYISYTMARLKSAGCEVIKNNKFNSKELYFAFLKAKFNTKPNILFEALYNHCVEINNLYSKVIIRDDDKNKLMFEKKLSDLILACNKLGLFEINKI